MAAGNPSSVRVKNMERAIAALVTGSLVLIVAGGIERRNVSLAAPASAQSAQPVAPWSWTPAPGARPPEPAVGPPAPAATDRAVPAPRVKRPPAPATSTTPSARTVDTPHRPAPAVTPTPSTPRAAGAEDGSAAIDWLFKD